MLPALSALVLVASSSSSPTIELPLERYEELIDRKAPRPARSMTVVESVRISGSLAKGAVVSIVGRSMGELPSVPVLEGEGLMVEGCTSDGALLTRSDQGQVMLTPLGNHFSVRCGLVTAEPPFSMSTRGVADVGGSLGDGTVRVVGSKDGLLTLVIARPEPKVPAVAELVMPDEALPTTVVGHYRLAVLPDDVRFRWELAAHNPNRTAIRFLVPSRANETLESLETAARHETTPQGFSVELPPGDTTIMVSGSMTGTHFEPPIEGTAQFVLVDSHPLLRVELTTDAKRLSPEETGMQAQYRAAQGLLLSRGEHIDWKVAVLQTLPATRYSVSSVITNYFVSADGALLANSTVSLDNQGASELAVPMKSTPEFASIGGIAVPLTHTEEGTLRLPLAHGPQEIVVQHRSAIDSRFGFAGGKLELPGLGTPATRSSVELRTSSDWVPLFYSFAGQRWFALPSLADLLLTLLFGIWAVHLLTSFGLERRRATVLGALIAILAASTEAAHWPVLIGLAGGSMLWVVAWLREAKIRLIAPSGLVGVSMAMGLGMLMMVGGVTLFGDNVRRLFGASADALAGDDNLSARDGYDSGLTKKTMRSFGSSDNYGGSTASASVAPVATPSYQGVGAARGLPSGQRNQWLSQEMADTTAPSAAVVILMSAALVHAAYALLHVLAVALAFMMRRQLLAGLKVQLERLFGARAVSPGEATV